MFTEACKEREWLEPVSARRICMGFPLTVVRFLPVDLLFISGIITISTITKIAFRRKNADLLEQVRIL